ncbi:MAG: hypothetical protein GF350_01200 [Chitinivibrionales bacterium]|nr:hypothetical protein [Chitinivibrionales bacterium]
MLNSASRNELTGRWGQQTAEIFHRKEYIFTDDSLKMFVPESDTVDCPDTKRYACSWEIRKDSIVVWDTVKIYYFRSLNYNLVNAQTLQLKLLGESAFETYTLLDSSLDRDFFTGGWVLDTAFIDQTPRELYRKQYSFTSKKVTYIEPQGPGKMPESKSAAWAIVDDTIMLCDTVERYGYGTALFAKENDSTLMLRQLGDSLYRKYGLRYRGM